MQCRGPVGCSEGQEGGGHVGKAVTLGHQGHFAPFSNAPSRVGSQKLPHWERVRKWSRDGKE